MINLFKFREVDEDLVPFQTTGFTATGTSALTAAAGGGCVAAIGELSANAAIVNPPWVPSAQSFTMPNPASDPGRQQIDFTTRVSPVMMQGMELNAPNGTIPQFAGPRPIAGVRTYKI